MQDLNILSKKTLDELRQIAKLIGMTKTSALHKKELVEAIIASENQIVQEKEVESVPQSGGEAPEVVKKRGRPKKTVEIKQDEATPSEPIVEPISEPVTTSVPEPVKTEAVVPAVLTQPVATPRGGEEDANKPAVRQRPDGVVEVKGFLETMPDGYGFIRFDNYESSPRDVYVSPTQIRRFNLKTGDEVMGDARPAGEGENKFAPLLFVHRVNGDTLDVVLKRKPFDELTPIYPKERLRLETKSTGYAMRLIDLIAPIGKGQRGLIVAPPKAGKTTLLKNIAQSIAHNHPDIKLIVLLIDERPEEVTDMKRSIDGDVIYSTFDEAPEHHTKIAELVLERAQRLVEHKKDVVILLDSITRLARAYNLVIPQTGRSLSGGLDPGALLRPKRFFGAARNIEEGGSLTILATALVETGSRMDEVIFEEFKGTGNMELRLDRQLQEKRIFPAVDIAKSSTRREEELLDQDELSAVWTVRKAMSSRYSADVTEQLITSLTHTRDNATFVQSIMESLGKS